MFDKWPGEAWAELPNFRLVGKCSSSWATPPKQNPSKRLLAAYVAMSMAFIRFQNTRANENVCTRLSPTCACWATFAHRVVCHSLKMMLLSSWCRNASSWYVFSLAGSIFLSHITLSGSKLNQCHKWVYNISGVCVATYFFICSQELRPVLKCT